MNNQLNTNNIAYEGGNGVYTARIMTNFDPEENELPYFAEQDNKIEVEEDKIRVYPNPTSDLLAVEFENDGELINGLFEVYDINGKIVFKQEFNTYNSYQQFTLNKLKNGVYLYKVNIKFFENNDIKEASGKLVILNN
jgi:hypothetical protein